MGTLSYETALNDPFYFLPSPIRFTTMAHGLLLKSTGIKIVRKIIVTIT